MINRTRTFHWDRDKERKQWHASTVVQGHAKVSDMAWQYDLTWSQSWLRLECKSLWQAQSRFHEGADQLLAEPGQHWCDIVSSKVVRHGPEESWFKFELAWRPQNDLGCDNQQVMVCVQRSMFKGAYWYQWWYISPRILVTAREVQLSIQYPEARTHQRLCKIFTLI